AELPGALDDLRERRGAERLALGEEAAARVDRGPRPGRAAAVADPAAAAVLRAEAELLRRQDLAGGVRVLELDDVHVLGPEARVRPGVARGRLRRRRDAVVGAAAHRRVLSQNGAGLVGAE